MAKILRGLRGATTATANTREAILEAADELLRALRDANDFQPEDVESAIFTSSPDLTAEYPARAARRLGWLDVPLLGAAAVAVPDGLPRCIRVLPHFYTTKPQRQLTHMYLREAAIRSTPPGGASGAPPGPRGGPGARRRRIGSCTPRATACRPWWWIATAHTSSRSSCRRGSSGDGTTWSRRSGPPSRPPASCFATTSRSAGTRGCRSR